MVDKKPGNGGKEWRLRWGQLPCRPFLVTAHKPLKYFDPANMRW